MTSPYDMPNPAGLVTVEGYARSRGITDRTVKRWLAAGELQGAAKDERGRWMIPFDAERAAGVVELVTGVTRPMTPRTLDDLPSFLPVDGAAAILGISKHAILSHREYFDVVPFGVNGSFVIPLATIKRIRG